MAFAALPVNAVTASGEPRARDARCVVPQLWSGEALHVLLSFLHDGEQISVLNASDVTASKHAARLARARAARTDARAAELWEAICRVRRANVGSVVVIFKVDNHGISGVSAPREDLGEEDCVVAELYTELTPVGGYITMHAQNIGNWIPRECGWFVPTGRLLDAAELVEWESAEQIDRIIDIADFRSDDIRPADWRYPDVRFDCVVRLPYTSALRIPEVERFLSHIGVTYRYAIPGSVDSS